jgi:hypothetical protein
MCPHLWAVTYQPGYGYRLEAHPRYGGFWRTLPMGFNNPIAGGFTLIRKALRSLGYTPGVSGWRINKDGSAEFNSLTIRGGQIISGVWLLYAGTPGISTLVASVAATPGTDSYGNPYVAGHGTYRYHFPGGAQGTGQLTAGLLSITDWHGNQMTRLQYSGGDIAGDGAVISNLAANAGLGGGSYGSAETWHNASLAAQWSNRAPGSRPPGTCCLRRPGKQRSKDRSPSPATARPGSPPAQSCSPCLHYPPPTVLPPSSPSTAAYGRARAPSRPTTSRD